jgi:hypothetical protein
MALRGVHHLVRVIRRGVPDHSDVVFELGGIADGRLDAGMRDQPDDDEPMDAVLPELQIQVGVGEAARAPMLLRDDLAGRRYELGAEFAAPGAVLEGLALPRRPLDGGDVLPCLVIAGTVAMMHGIEYPKLRLARRVQNFQHMGYTVVGLGNSFDARPDLATFGNEVVVGIDDQKGGDALVVCRDIHGSPPAMDCPLVGVLTGQWSNRHLREARAL